MSDSSQINRRAFLGKSAAVIAGGVVLPRTALSYENIVGANDRISLGHIGIGSRGGDLDSIAVQAQVQSSGGNDRGLRFMESKSREGRGDQCGLLRPKPASGAVSGRTARDEGCGWR